MKPTSYPTSIITRIETDFEIPDEYFTVTFLPHFHYNKDWNRLNGDEKVEYRKLLTPLPL